MFRTSRIVALVLASLLGGGVVFGGVGVASAAIVPDFGDILDLFNYKLLKSGTELQAAMGPTARAAWSTQTARLATQSASAYNIAAATSGLNEVKPDPIYLRPQDLPAIKPTGGFKNFTTKFTGVGLNKPTAVVGVTAAMVGFQFRAEIADGVTSWIGFDAQSAVCADPTASGGFVNFITGQNCDAWKFPPEYVPNEDYLGSLTFGVVCSGTVCVEPVSVIQYNTRGQARWSGVTVVCVNATGGVVGSDQRRDLSPLAFFVHKPNEPSVTIAAGRDTEFKFGYGVVRISAVPSTGFTDWQGTVRNCGPEANGLVQMIHGENNNAGTDWLPPVVGEYAVGPGSGTLATAPSSDVPQDGSNRSRLIRCIYTFSDSSSASELTEPFTESMGFVPQPRCPVIPPGVDVTHMKITLESGGDVYILDEQDSLADPLGAGTETNGVTTAYCGSNLCILELMDNRSGRSCFDQGDVCDGWLQSPTRDVDYTCYYGGVVQDFRQCFVYAHVFNTAKRLAGNPYADPKTGDDLDVISGLSLDALTMGTAPRPAAFGRNCFGGDWGATNPVNWVLRPIQCALEWAFVARPSVVTANSEVIKAGWENTAPGKVVTAVQSWSFAPGSTGCQGPPLNISYLGLSGYPLSACEGTMLSALAGPGKVLTTVLLILGGAFVIIRLVAGVINYRGIDG